MNMQELQQLSQEELAGKLVTARQELFAMKKDVATGKEKNFAQLKDLKATVARVFTAIKAKEAK
ncbi:MAG: 50S ribosomal protein L29 [Candidatus Andersenbacteria bacterium]